MARVVHVSARAYGRQPGSANKYHAKRTTVDGQAFDSHREAQRYQLLKVQQTLGEIRDLTVHPVFPLVVNNRAVGRFTLDFSYRDRRGRLHVEDVKAKPTMTEAYRLRKRVFEALYDLTVEEIL